MKTRPSARIRHRPSPRAAEVDQHRRGPLYDERLGELRQIARRQLLYSLGANLATGVVLGATLLLLTWLTLSGRVALAQAGVAVAGVALSGSRLAQAG